MRLLTIGITILFLFSGFAITAGAEDVAKAVVKAGITASFDELEKQMIYKYFGEHQVYAYEYEEEEEAEESSSSGKGNKHKNKGLPPGIAKKLERGGTMPPGIAKKFLPATLEKKLPPPPSGYERTIVGKDVLLVQINTGLIADIITDAILGK